MTQQDWINECVSHYLAYGFQKENAQQLASEHALEEENSHGAVVILWEPPESLVKSKLNYTIKPISECVDEPDIQMFLNKLKSGEIQINTGPEKYTWTEEQKQELSRVLEDIFKENK